MCNRKKSLILRYKPFEIPLLSKGEKTTFRFEEILLPLYFVKKPRQCPALSTFFALFSDKITFFNFETLLFHLYLTILYKNQQ